MHLPVFHRRMKTAPQAPIQPAASVAKRRIFIVDDHHVTRRGVAALINQEPDFETCGESDSAPDALDLLVKIKADLVIADISLKTVSGIELTKKLKVLLPDLPVLVMSMHDESLYAERALHAGAKGYVMKQEASDNVLAAIRCILAGDLYLSARIKEKILNRLVCTRRDQVVFSMDTLSDREMEVFQLLGNGYSTRNIAVKLGLSIKTIDSYREHLKVKLKIEKGADLVRHAIEWVRSESIL